MKNIELMMAALLSHCTIEFPRHKLQQLSNGKTFTTQEVLVDQSLFIGRIANTLDRSS